MRLRKSTALHLLQSTEPEWKQHRDDPIAGDFRRPKMPAYLPPAAAQEWRRINAALKQRGRSCDASALEIYCRLFSQYLALCDSTELKQQKLALSVANSLRAYQKEFFSTPASRKGAKPVAPKPPKPKPRADGLIEIEPLIEDDNAPVE
jgi:phage terminase small subunit